MRKTMFAITVLALTVGLNLTAPAPARADGCGGQAWAPPGGGWEESRGNASVWGHPGYRKGYSFGPTNNDTYVHVQAKGFDEATNEERWYSVYYGNRGGQGSVPWGNNIAEPAIRVSGAAMVMGAYIDWSC